MKFKFAEDFVIDTDEEPWCREGLRITPLGGPGSGKSWNNSLLVEQFLSQGGTVVIFQPRDEYFTLKEKFDIVSVGGVHAKDMEFALTSPALYARAVVEDGVSMCFYTSAVESEEKLVDFVARFIGYLMRFQEKHKRPLMVLLEDAEDYIPKSASGHVAPPWVYNRMVKRFKDLFSQGRKLNIIGIASSQRPQQVNFTIRQLANLVFYGRFAPQDITYIQKECLKPYKEKGIVVDANQLLNLSLGQWLVITGKQARFITVTEPRLTKHGAETPRLEYVAPHTTKTKRSIDQLTKTILEALENLVEPVTRGDPESPLRWTCKSTYHLRDDLLVQGYRISQPQVGKLLAGLGYSLQAPRKTDEGGTHPDRDAQFRYINAQVKRFQRRELPVISVDTKKKENIGNYANKGQEYQSKGQPTPVKVYDFVDKTLGKVAPYGIYDIGRP